MRVISGTLKGRRFQPPAKIPARPTTDFAKEGLFNILTNQRAIDEESFLDLFGGTGSISYEMGSRGCEKIVLVEKDPKSAAFIRQQSEAFGLNIQVLQMDVFEYIRSAGYKYSLIFAGPPYALPTLNQIPGEIFEAQLLEPGGWLILEHNPNHDFSQHPYYKWQRNYGTTFFAIFEQP
ncbi:MAG TPA: hypothetical protein DHW15_13350, partial [Bacteroidetes bacterium]|jgi:16S rRNA (guanine966-N2)-methyltransferase|nr:MAG: hypothetical protein ABR94_09550 [Sphingobacteriales bacterium BACL12 MAG-120802-bin5]KRP10494.1 MAG: hypothetical protein ABR95_02060 [Sphingobacteriales bacterium BACL12 MAG-120813-bin55]HCK23096.1 hypothetical protein [Bacteroidota bacterium]